MRRTRKILSTILILAMVFTSMVGSGLTSYAEDVAGPDDIAEATTEDTFQGTLIDENAQRLKEITSMDESGNVTLDESGDGSMEEEAASSKSRAATTEVQVVNLNTQGSGVTTAYTEEATGTTTYIAGTYGADAAYLGTSDGKVRFLLAGMVGLVDPAKVEIIPYSSAKSISNYKVSGGRLIHYITTNMNSSNYASTLDNGEAPSYLASGTTYYSYDGHYFYTNYATMITDCQNNKRSNSVNPTNPYYNYFQYLVMRSTTSYTAEELDTIINQKVSSTSKLRGMGSVFAEYQDVYGVNALLMLGIAANESAWGTSNLATSKNNLFGLGAVDSSPGTSADTYASAQECVKQFAESWMSKQYCNPSIWKYFGAFLGSKASGVNLMYASDPYWGEKAANAAMTLDKLGGNKDYKKYTIGIKDVQPTNHTNADVRKESNTSSNILYTTKSQSAYPILLLSTTSDNGFFKIQSDGVLNSGRTGLDKSTGQYSFPNMYGYIPAQYVNIVSTGDGSVPAVEEDTAVGVKYQTHVQTYGWQNWVKNGTLSGTTGEAKRLEGIQIQLNNPDFSGSIQYRTHIQSYGWQNWVSDGAMSGTSGQAKRLEAIQIKLTGEMAENYDIYYRVHAQTYGWLDWAKNGQAAGTEGLAKRLEAIQIKLVKKNENAPGSTATPFQSLYTLGSVRYDTHCQTYGWLNYSSDGASNGTIGQAKRLEGIHISLSPNIDGGIKYRTHIQTYGWENSWKSNGSMSGTFGQAKRLEAIQIELTDDAAEKYDVYYRVHAQTFGWMGWAKNGEQAGTAGYAKRLESIQVQLVPKGEKAPGSTDKSFVSK